MKAHNTSKPILVTLNDQFVNWVDTNEDLWRHLKEVALPQVRFLQVPLPGSKIPAQVRIQLPPGFRDYEEFKFPLILHV